MALHARWLTRSCCCTATDILLGYHSEEGWTAAIHLLTKHYGVEVEVGFSSYVSFLHVEAHEPSSPCLKEPPKPEVCGAL